MFYEENSKIDPLSLEVYEELFFLPRLTARIKDANQISGSTGLLEAESDTIDRFALKLKKNHPRSELIKDKVPKLTNKRAPAISRTTTPKASKNLARDRSKGRDSSMGNIKSRRGTSNSTRDSMAEYSFKNENVIEKIGKN